MTGVFLFSIFFFFNLPATPDFAGPIFTYLTFTSREDCLLANLSPPLSPGNSFNLSRREKNLAKEREESKLVKLSLIHNSIMHNQRERERGRGKRAKKKRCLFFIPDQPAARRTGHVVTPY